MCRAPKERAWLPNRIGSGCIIRDCEPVELGRTPAERTARNRRLARPEGEPQQAVIHRQIIPSGPPPCRIRRMPTGPNKAEVQVWRRHILQPKAAVSWKFFAS